MSHVSVKSKSHRKILNSIVGADLPVIEGKKAIHIQVVDQDIKHAVRGDGDKCALALACKRIYGSRVAYFFRTIAYVELFSNKGVKQLQRFTITESGRKFVQAVDAGKKVNPCGFDLYPPGKSKSLEGRAEESRKQIQKRKAAKTKAVIKGETDKDGERIFNPNLVGRGNKTFKPSYSRLTRASGMGQVHFKHR